MQRTQEEAVMHATLTRLSFQSDDGVEAAEAALRRVIDGLPATLGVRDCYVVETAARALVLFTAYDSEAEADAASASMRPMIAAEVGPLVAGTPSRSEGRVVVRRGCTNPDDY
jgi:hypothetical protein